MPVNKFKIKPGKITTIPIKNKKEEELIKFINKNCSEYITLCKASKKVLFRGIKDIGKNSFLGHPRKDRRPESSDKETHDFINMVLDKAGLATRGNSIFCTSDFTNAENYGNLYIIFPINGSKYMWNPTNPDLIMSPEAFPAPKWYNSKYPKTDIKNAFDMITKFRRNYKKIYAGNPKAADLYDLMCDEFIFLEGNYQDDDGIKIFRKNLVSLIRIISQYNKYQIDKTLLVDIQPWIRLNKICATYKPPTIDKATAQKLAKYYKFTDQNLVKAFKTEFEVCVQGNYLALEAESYGMIINNNFFNNSISDLDDVDDVDDHLKEY